MSTEERSPATDSPWFWVLIFSLMALFVLVLMGPKIGRRQAKIELKYQARERIAADQATGNNSADNPRSEQVADRREFASADDTLVPLWPLAAILVIAVLFSWFMLIRRGPSL
jgi:hypothetical protein